jgi:hypothetical protein
MQISILVLLRPNGGTRMRYLNRIVISDHMYIIGDKSVTLMDWKPAFTRTRKNANSRARQTYNIQNATMPNTRITREEWRTLGKHQRCKATGRQWQIEDYCRYCPDFLIERSSEEAEDPCVQCGIRDTLREELEQSKASDSDNRESSQYKSRGD